MRSLLAIALVAACAKDAPDKPPAKPAVATPEAVPPAPAASPAAQAADKKVAECAGGSGLACDDAADFYANGTGVPQDLARAAQLYQKACDAGLNLGCRHVARLYLDGR